MHSTALPLFVKMLPACSLSDLGVVETVGAVLSSAPLDGDDGAGH